MIHSLRTAIDASASLKDEEIIIGAGHRGCEAFRQPARTGASQVLLTWQWLDAMKDLASGTVVVMPQHALDARFASVANKVSLIKIQGVLQTRTLAATLLEDPGAIAQATETIVMLPGDTEQENGTWACYTPNQVKAFMATLGKRTNTLFLNGPRTGKFKQVQGRSVLDPEAHRTGVDGVTRRVRRACAGRPWRMVDFRFGAASLWGPALRFCLVNPGTILILPGESTSMIAEALGLGLRPAIAQHSAMTATSRRYVEELARGNLVTIYPVLPTKGETTQAPTVDQARVVLEALGKLLGY